MKSWLLSLGGLLLVLGGCSLTNSYLTQDRFAQVPRMTCDQLAQQGAPADRQVTITDLRLSNKGIVANRYEGELEVCVPVFPAHVEEEPEPAKLAFLLRVWGDRDWRRIRDHPGPVEVTCRAERSALQAPVCRGPQDLEPWAWNGLEKQYPGISLPTIWLLTVGHGTTPTAEQAASAFRYGIGELLIGGILLGWGVVMGQRPDAPTTDSAAPAGDRGHSSQSPEAN